MFITIKTANSHNINDGTNYRTTLLNQRGNPNAKGVFIEQTEADSVDADTYTVETQTKVLSIEILNYAQRHALISQLKGWFKRGIRVDLVGTFIDDGVDYQINCRAVNLVQDPVYGTRFNAILQTGTTAWRSVAPQTDTWTVTGTGGVKVITVGGDDETRLIAALTATVAPGTGYFYQNLYRLPNVSGINYGWRYWCLTVDTAALVVDASKSNQVNQGGGINASTLSIPIDTPVGGGLPTTGGIAYVDTEQIRYSSISGGVMTVVTGGRGYGGTTAATHADNAVIKVSKILANCNDLRIFNGPREIKRWIVNPNTSATNIWFKINMRAGSEINLLTGINNSQTVTSLQFAQDATTKAVIDKMPNVGIIYHGTEWFSYSARDAINCKLTIRARGVWGTTKQAHVAGNTFVYIQNAIRMVYGNSAATNPSLADVDYDNEKPPFSLTSSDNTKRVWDSTSRFYDPDNPGRVEQWLLTEKKLGTASHLYHIKGDVETDDPAIGLKVGSFKVGSVWKSDTVELAFSFYCAGGFSSISATGRKKRSGTNWPTTGFQRSIDAHTWFDLWVEATPSVAGSFENWVAHTAVSVATTSKYLRHVLSGIFPIAANHYAMTEGLTLTAVFVSANLPTGAFLGEASNYTLSLAMSNDLSGDIVRLTYPALYNLAFLMDGEEFDASFDNVNAHQSIDLDDESRDAWLRLRPGANTLTIVATDVGTLGIALSWYRRRL